MAGIGLPLCMCRLVWMFTSRLVNASIFMLSLVEWGRADGCECRMPLEDASGPKKKSAASFTNWVAGGPGAPNVEMTTGMKCSRLSLIECIAKNVSAERSHTHRFGLRLLHGFQILRQRLRHFGTA